MVTMLQEAIRDLILNIFTIISNFLCLPIAVWKLVKALISRKKPIVPQVVAITGANSGIGEGIAYAYAKDKISLVLLARRLDLLETVAEACRELGSPDVKVVQMDVADTKSVSAFFDEKTTEYGIDLFIANAGISHVPDKELLDHAEPIFQVNVMGALAGINSVYKAMRKRGRGGQIAVVSSVLGLYNPASMLCYSASKAAILSYCRDLRALGKDDGITVNIIAPGYIDTAMTSAWSKKNAFFFLKSDYFGEQVKKGLENDVSLISLPFSQFLPFAIAAALPVFAKESLSQLLHVLVDSKLMKKNQ